MYFSVELWQFSPNDEWRLVDYSRSHFEGGSLLNDRAVTRWRDHISSNATPSLPRSASLSGDRDYISIIQELSSEFVDMRLEKTVAVEREKVVSFIVTCGCVPEHMTYKEYISKLEEDLDRVMGAVRFSFMATKSGSVEDSYEKQRERIMEEIRDAVADSNIELLMDGSP